MRCGWLSFALLLSFAAPRAAAAGDFSRFGPYVGVGGSYATALWDEELEDELDVSVHVDDAWGVNARVGLRIFQGLAVEAQYEWLDSYGVELAGIDALDVESTHALTANLKLILPLWRVQPYLLAGVGFTRVKIRDKVDLGISDSETSLAGRGALGLDVYLTDHIALFAEGGVVVVDQKIDPDIPGVGKVEPLFYTGAQLGVMFRF